MAKATKDRSGCGRYQYLLFFMVMAGTCSHGWYVYAITFYTMMPGFECLQDTLWYECSRVEACAATEYRYAYNSNLNLLNFV